jgi:hypothetical protein
MKSKTVTEKKPAKDSPAPAGPASKPYTLAPLTTEEALRKLLNVKPEKLAELKKAGNKTGKPSAKKG